MAFCDAQADGSRHFVERPPPASLTCLALALWRMLFASDIGWQLPAFAPLSRTHRPTLGRRSPTHKSNELRLTRAHTHRPIETGIQLEYGTCNVHAGPPLTDRVQTCKRQTGQIGRGRTKAAFCTRMGRKTHGWTAVDNTGVWEMSEF